jgi:hypothetical protein
VPTDEEELATISDRIDRSLASLVTFSSDTPVVCQYQSSILNFEVIRACLTVGLSGPPMMNSHESNFIPYMARNKVATFAVMEL